ncbi:amidohydrolase family protein [Nocardioides piscis]|uniref:Amidohydrolase family protein n=1 Tax=Nocardioides piscis TaxID=2714938 RepID=A0A6G7YD71_9ACTN|nr:amidohydrolase family protein [Nocardioides piscis]QIK74720.1 amidohydrolase family protein [Nocardioides piscis]
MTYHPRVLRRRTALAVAAAVPISATALHAPPGSASGVAPSSEHPRHPRGPGTVDVHAHLLPDYYREALRRHGVRRVSGLPVPVWSPRLALRFMNSWHIAAQVLSVPDPAVSFLRTPGARVEMARRLNDTMAALATSSHGRWAGRFGGLAVLPLAADSTPEEIMAAATEARRALTELRLDGVSLLSNYGATYLSDPRFAPLLAALSDLGARVAVHPNVAGPIPATIMPPYLLEGAFNMTRAIVAMSYLQVFTAHPGIHWLMGEAGGALPYLAYRTSLLQLYPAAAQNLGLSDLDDQNIDYGGLSFDTAASAAPAAMSSVREVVPVEQILFGTDWPLRAPAPPRRGATQPALRKVFNEAELRRVTRTNALEHFPALAARMARAR